MALTVEEWASARGERWQSVLGPMEAMLAPIDEPLLAALELSGARRIADLGCGGGSTTRRVAERASPAATVDGFDVSAALVETARGSEGPGDVPLTFHVADLSRAAPPLGPYDRLVSRFGVMFFEDPQAAFHNLAGWLEPGGRFAFAVWGTLEDNPWVGVVRDVVRQFVELPVPPADAPGPFRYGEPARLVSLLERAGFGGFEVRDVRIPLVVGGGLPSAEAARFSIAAYSVADRLKTLAPEAQRAAAQALGDRLRSSEVDGRVVLGARVFVVCGVRA